VCPVPPLPVPPEPGPPDSGGGLAAVSAAASVRLLADRARAVRPGFAVTEANAADAARICRMLDGMPLAIELAAARLRTMSPAQLAGRLGDRFAVLTGGSRTALPRRRTLRAVVEWSWDLLSKPERVLARRLAAAALRTAGARRAAELLGAADSIRGAVDHSSLDAPAVRAAAGRQLGEAAFSAAYQRGFGLPGDEALGFARASAAGPGAGDR
jgi:predicted ATPase